MLCDVAKDPFAPRIPKYIFSSLSTMSGIDMTSNNENIQSLIKTYMKRVSSCLRQHYPNTYEQFLRSMFDLNEDKISPSQCLVQIRLSLCDFPLLVDKFEQLYNTLVNFSSTKNYDFDKKRKRNVIDCTQENNAKGDTYSPTADKQTWKRARLYCDAKAYQEDSDGSSLLSNADNMIDGSRMRKANLVAKKTVMLPRNAGYSSTSSNEDIESASSDGDDANSDDDNPSRNIFGPEESIAVEKTAAFHYLFRCPLASFQDKYQYMNILYKYVKQYLGILSCMLIT